jgi:hypothetical protein
MQTHLKAPAPQAKQQASNVLAQPQGGFEDKRQQMAQLQARQAMMSSSPQQARMLVQRRRIATSDDGEIETNTLSRETMLAWYRQELLAGVTVTEIRDAIVAHEHQGEAIDLDMEGFTIPVEGVQRTMFQLNAFTQEVYHTHSNEQLNEIWNQIIPLNLADSPDKTYLLELHSKLHNAWTLRDERVQAETDWETTYGIAPGAGGTLHDMVYNMLVHSAANAGSTPGMSTDALSGNNADTQLAICLRKCRDNDEATLALCMYTSYFYAPVNNYYRGALVPDVGTQWGRLIIRTAEILTASYGAQEEVTDMNDQRFRLELRAGWIPDATPMIGFPSLVSTHPAIGGVKAMWGNVADGTFGICDNLALLCIEGSAKIKRPINKYFETEEEDVIEPGNNFNVVDHYSVEGEIPGMGVRTIRVFQISNAEGETAVRARLNFADIV